APAGARRRAPRRSLRQRLEGHQRRRGAHWDRRLRRAAADHPGRLAQGRVVRAARRRSRTPFGDRVPDRRDGVGARRRAGERGRAVPPRRRSPARSRCRCTRREARRGRPALSGVRELRPVPRLRGARRRVPRARPGAGMRRAQLEAHLLVLVTLALVAFGLVMVYSATSAPAAMRNGDPSSYLKRQAVYAVVGFALLLVLSRTSYRTLRRFAPTIVTVALILCLAVLVVGPQVNGARRWLTPGPATFQPSQLANPPPPPWVPASPAPRPPRALPPLARPLGLLVGLFCLVLLLQPALGTAITVVVMVALMLAVAGVPGRLLAGAGAIALTLGLLAIWFEPYRR